MGAMGDVASLKSDLLPQLAVINVPSASLEPLFANVLMQCRHTYTNS